MASKVLGVKDIKEETTAGAKAGPDIAQHLVVFS